MNSEKSKILNKEIELVSKLSDEQLLREIPRLRKEGLPELTPVLIERFEVTKDDGLKQSLFQFFSDTRNQEELQYFMNAIMNTDYKSSRNELISVLWQSALDASDYLKDLTEIALEGDPMTIIEISTVIDNFDTAFPEDDILDSIYRIDEVLLEEGDADRSKLLHSLKSVISELYTL